MGSIADKLWHRCARIAITLWRTTADKLWWICAHLCHNCFNAHIRSQVCAKEFSNHNTLIFLTEISFQQRLAVLIRWENEYWRCISIQMWLFPFDTVFENTKNWQIETPMHKTWEKYVEKKQKPYWSDSTPSRIFSFCFFVFPSIVQRFAKVTVCNHGQIFSISSGRR